MGDPITIGLLVGGEGLKMYSSIQQGYAQKAQLETEARMADLQAKQVETNASIEEAERKKRLQNIIATQTAMFSAGGIDVTSGTPFNLMESSMQQEARETGIARTQADINRQIFEQQASSARGAKRSVMKGVIISSLGSALQTGASISSIGSAPKTNAPKAKGVK